jgi:carbamoyl-phosphate synthase small subunit
MNPAMLVLEDGACFTGEAFGAIGRTVCGEAVFNTAMSGYQEALTDPSYAGQILCMTAPQIGNYGVCAEDDESTQPQVRGFVVRELARRHSNHRAETDVSAWLATHGVPGITGIDTRALVRRLRVGGAMRAALSSDPAVTAQALLERCREAPVMSGQNLAACASVTQARTWTGDLGVWDARRDATPGDERFRVIALDCGGKHSIYRHLASVGCDVEVLPSAVTAEEILAREPHGLFISNGPGDPAAVVDTIATLGSLLGQVPTFGICLGHQLLALALGATTYKLKFGHRGTNQPVRNLLTGRVEITSQNHGFCVEAGSLEEVGGEVTHVHLNDGTPAGFRHTSFPLFSVQYHPEASPGPHDSSYLFDCFVEIMASRRPVDAELMQRTQLARLAIAGQEA